MIDRLISQRLRKNKKSVLLLGPRQVGKSTLCRSLKPSQTINLADESLYLSYLKDPSRLLRELRAKPNNGIILVDEIQRVPALLNSIQAHIDEGGAGRFILTGSSARKLYRGGVNLLPGRIVLEYLDPLTIWELKESFDLEKSLSTGSLPGVVTDPEEGVAVLSSYAQTYLREEIQGEALSRNVGSYARFLDLAAEASGDWINYSKLSSDSEIPKETIRRYYDILTETLIAIRIPAFWPKKSHRRISQRDRYVFFDVGVRNAVLGLAGQKLPLREKGRLFEQWFVIQIMGFIHAHQKNWKVSSFRTDNGFEVDWIIDTGKRILALECKYSVNIGQDDLKGLKIFESFAQKPVKKFIIYLGDRAQKFSDKEVAIHYKDFLLEELPSFD